VGGGYIGLEMAAGLSMNGLDVRALLQSVLAISRMRARALY
jgi:NADPH-dependent 2,4-dienoyl-CoA reductase/sulfur reductase-like enzyme